MAFSLDATRLATSDDETVRVWDAATAEDLFFFNISGHTAYVWRLAFSPDGRRLATASGHGTAKVWAAVTGEELL